MRAPRVFATVGTQLPFDRLLLALNDWAARRPQACVTAQTGQTEHHFSALHCATHLATPEFARHLLAADVIVSHAGMGTILMAAEAGKPLIVLPRRAALGEHRNDHQLATAARMAGLSNVTILPDAAALAETLDAALARRPAPWARPAAAQPRLIAALRAFIQGDGPRT
ncbi:MAG: hypothetical protein RIT14_139 [Pseudomonadota bacterium]|jgi:UDP-N-acetylglucosamine transferase subunit ALG13